MTQQTEHASVKRVRTELESHGIATEIRHLADTARTAIDAANVLEVEVGQIASSIVFKIDTDQGERPLLVVTSGRHRVDTQIVAAALQVPKLGRADADFVRLWSGFAIGGVSPLGWISKPEIILIDEALSDYDVVWAAAGHPHAVYPTTYDELIQCTGAQPMIVGD
jgi:prolyl-tRNA editing enzyme YbaK/EbsC (Cys-tRNA(Pro) deacylase)